MLFPGGLLPLKIFEQRYLDMTKACLRDNLPFGVCRIREGHEVGTPVTHENVGCLASIEQWDMPNSSMFHLLARGGERFRIRESSVASNGLISAEVDILPPASRCSPDPACVALIKGVIEKVGAENFPPPVQLDDGLWVAYRIAEMMNIPIPIKQWVLEADYGAEIFSKLKNIIKSDI